MSFVKRKLDFTFQLGQGNFGKEGYDQVKVSGLRATVEILNANGPSMGEAHARIYGLTPSIMNQLAQIMRTPQGNIEVRWNNIIIEAGDDEVGMAKVFEGQITLAPIDMTDMPQTALVIVAHAGAFEAVKSVPPSSYPGSADAAVIMQNLAALAGYAFENNGVSVLLATPYFPGALRDQMTACAEAANINWTIDNGTLAIWRKGGSRGDLVPLVSPDTGSYGYPTNWGMGVFIKTLFNPQLRIGKTVAVQSSLPFAKGRFTMFDIGHQLESEMPNGQWFTSFHGTPFNATP